MTNDARVCPDCSSKLKSGANLCRVCGSRVGTSSYTAEGDGTYLLSEAKDTPAEHWPTGPWDVPCLAGGLVPGGITLIGGEKGCGKSTMALAMASRLGKKGIVLYAAGEQAGEELKQTASRLLLENLNRIRIVPAIGGFQDDFGDVLLGRRPGGGVIIDSLQGIFDETSNIAPMVTFVKRLKDYALEFKVPFVVISQITKDGQFAGAEAIPHACDTVLSLSIGDGGLRTLLTEKNRYGRAPVAITLAMTDTGFVKTVESEGETDDSDED